MNKENPICQGDEMKNLIPQRDPIIQIDSLYCADETTCETGLTIKEDNMFCEDGFFTEPGLIEHIAQSASAFAGYTALKKGLPAPIGYIGEVKKFKITRLPLVGETIDTSVQIISEINNISLLSAESKVNGFLAASCQMKIFIKDEQTN